MTCVDFLVELGTAVGTLAMAVTTLTLIFQNKRHYQDERRPVCVIVLNQDVDPFNRIDVLRFTQEQSGPYKRYRLYCEKIVNIGTGPAVRVYLQVRFLDRNGTIIGREIQPLGVNEALYTGNRCCLMVPVPLNNTFDVTDFESALIGPWEVWLTYVDVFGNTFHTKHAKDPEQPWVVLGKGDVPRNFA